MTDNVYPQHDAGNAQRLADQISHRARWVTDWGAWIVHDGRHWERQRDDILVEGLAKVAAISIIDEASRMTDDDARRRMLLFASKSLSQSAIRAAVASSKSIPALHIKSDELDRDPLALNVRNGTVDLRTGKLAPHDPAQFITRLVRRDYHENVYSPLWDGLIKRTTKLDPTLETADLLELALGYCLVGGNPENRMFFLIGPAGTGKSQVVEIPVEILGQDYAWVSKPSLITRGRNEVNTEEMAVIEHKRFISISETDMTMELDEAAFKSITGARRIPMRNLYGRQRLGEVEATFIVGTNEAPTIEKFDDSIARRLVIIPSGPSLTSDEKDIRLARRIVEFEAEGVLSSLVRGAVKWHQQSEKLANMGAGSAGSVFDQLPAAVSIETDTFKYEHDPIIEFVDEFLEFESYYREPMSRLNDEYVKARRGKVHVGKRKLYERIEAIALERGHDVSRTQREFMGLRIRAESMTTRLRWEP